MSRRAPSLLLVGAGIAGTAAVSLAGMAAHKTPDPMLVSASNILMVHAAAIAAIAAIAQRAARTAGLVAAAVLLLLGSGLFAGSIASLVIGGSPLFAMATPLGGMLMITGWIVLTASALFVGIAERQ